MIRKLMTSFHNVARRSVQITLREGEDVLLLDNSDSTTWRVRSAAGQEADVPALVILIPGPFREAIDAAVKWVQSRRTRFSTQLQPFTRSSSVT